MSREEDEEEEDDKEEEEDEEDEEKEEKRRGRRSLYHLRVQKKAKKTATSSYTQRDQSRTLGRGIDGS